jgi:hypothetical protein
LFCAAIAQRYYSTAARALAKKAHAFAEKPQKWQKCRMLRGLYHNTLMHNRHGNFWLYFSGQARREMLASREKPR